MSPLSQSERDDLRTHVVQSYCQTARKEHARILQRRQIIEERKEELENLNVQRVRGRLTGGCLRGGCKEELGNLNVQRVRGRLTGGV